MGYTVAAAPSSAAASGDREGAMTPASPHHHGSAIRAYRARRRLTQAQLAERWPGGPVNPRYVQRVETGKKHLSDQRTLRGLAQVLDIPLWEFGLSEYDPFSPHNLPGCGVRMYRETLEVVELCVRQTWSLRCAGLLPQAYEGVLRLDALFAHFQRDLPPPARLERDFLRLHAQALRLDAIACIERREYARAMALFADMHATAQALDEPATLAVALLCIGAEHARAGRPREAVDWLERARDVSFGAGKHVAAFVLAYLARACAAAADAPRFERALETACSLVDALGPAFGDGADFIYARRGSVLAERSWGSLRLRRPRATLGMRAEIAAQVERDGDLRLQTWLHLDWARAHLMLGAVEASVEDASAFYRRASAMGSAHAVRLAHRFASRLEAAGYADVPVARDLRAMLGRDGPQPAPRRARA
jgi:hypothetical protein